MEPESSHAPSSRVLAQLLLMQSILPVLPGESAIVDFVGRGMADIPGVASVRHAQSDPIATAGPEGRVLRVPVRFGPASHGEIWITLSDPSAFAPYEPHVRNFLIALAVVLEERRQRQQNAELARELEQRVEERTRQLALFRALLDQSADYLEVVDPESARILDVSERACADLGYSRDEYLALRIPDIDPTVDPASFDKVVEALRRGPLLWEGTHRRKDGSVFPVEVNLRLVRLDREYVVAAVRDVSARHRAEEEHQKFMLGVMRSSDAVFMTDREGTITFVNPAFEKLYEFSRAEALGKTPRILKSGNTDPAFYSFFWNALTSNHVVKTELTNRTKSGRVVQVDASANPIVDASGNVVGFLAIQRDITERKHAEEVRAELEAQLRTAQKMEAVGILAGGVAHDFNNLLTVINSFTFLAMEQLRDGDPLREDLDEVRKAGERAAALTRQLLAFGRRQLLQPVPLDLNQVTTHLDKMLRRIIGEDITLTLELAPDLGPTLADPGQIEQVIMNLAVNARDAMPRGGKLTLRTANVELDRQAAAMVSAPAPGAYVLLTVADTGSGMDARTLTQIFEPFFTTKAPGKGTGLGLSTVHGIIRQSGGAVSVRSEVGRGTLFDVYLPLHTEPAVPVAAPSVAAPSVEAPSAAGRETVLVVEDDEGLRKLTERILRGAGYTVLSAASAGDALLIAETYQGKLDLLVTDVVMPSVSGPALVERWRQSRPDTPVLYMSGHTNDAILRHGVAARETQFIQKPFTPAALAQKVRAVLDGEPP